MKNYIGMNFIPFINFNFIKNEENERLKSFETVHTDFGQQ